MEFLLNVGMFAAKAFLIVGAILVVFSFIFFSFGRIRQSDSINVENLGDRYDHLKHVLQSQLLEKKAYKAFAKSEKKKRDEVKNKPRVFVLDFKGDLRANAVDRLREEISALLTIAQPTDEVVVKVESPGGLVSAYGLAASQLARIRDRQIRLTVAVDQVAASGGYMMACVADQILAAPFAILGSIGVVAQVPNFHRVLDKLNVEYHEVTAGEYKRTVSLLAPISAQGMEKFKAEIESTHVIFKSFVERYRPQVDIAKAATGEHWLGVQALELKLVDKIQTSDDYITSRLDSHEMVQLEYKERRSLTDKLSESLAYSAENALLRTLTWLSQSRFGT